MLLRLRVLLAFVLPLVLFSLPFVSPANSFPVAGFVEEWSGTDPHGWGGGSSPTSNPGTGGLLGSGDGYLVISNTFSGHLGSFPITDDYIGDWAAAGITKVGFWLNDVGADQALEIHFGIGHAQVNFWQYDLGFIPPEHRWAQFSVDLTSSAGWTQIINAGNLSFADALQDVDRVLIRHDLAPYQQTPNSILGDFGVDHFVMTDGPLSVPGPTASVSAPVELAPPYPNPSRGAVSLALRTYDANPVRIEVLDVGGRVVRREALGAAPSGLRIWVWDGRDDRGQPVATGAYRVRAFGASGGTSQPLIRLR